MSDKMRAEIRRLKAELKQRDKQIANFEHVADDAASIRREIFNLVEAEPKSPGWLVRQIKGDTSGVPMILLSDWHWGETVDLAQTGGANAFNRKIADERVKHLVETTESLCFDHMTHPQYPGIVCCLGGDMISGFIHEELRETNWGTPTQQFIEVQDRLVWVIERLADKFGHVFVPCVVGNHGRTTHKPQMKNRVFTNYEWLLYQQLERHFRHDSRIIFAVPEETDCLFTVQGHRFMLTHGDTLGVKGGDGIIGAVGPIVRGTRKIQTSESQIGRSFDTLLMGHWHTYCPRGDMFPTMVNGTLKGYDEYARLGLRVPYSRPSQALWFVHEKHGITAQWQIYLDGTKPAKSAPRIKKGWWE